MIPLVCFSDDCGKTELYNFEDFEPTPLPCQPEPKIYSSVLWEDMDTSWKYGIYGSYMSLNDRYVALIKYLN